MILCKSPDRAAAAVEEIVQRSKAPSDRVRSLPLNLADLESVRKCADVLKLTVDQVLLFTHQYVQQLEKHSLHIFSSYVHVLLD